jgi:hypothetical protein
MAGGATSTRLTDCVCLPARVAQGHFALPVVAVTSMTSSAHDCMIITGRGRGLLQLAEHILGIRVVSDGSTTGLGFTAHFESLPFYPYSPGCASLRTMEGGYVGPVATGFNRTLSLDLSTPAFTPGRCEWTVTPGAGFTVRVDITRFDVRSSVDFAADACCSCNSCLAVSS